jgi:hypothetical protein
MGIENKATKSGNVDDATVWSLGRIPQAGDDCYTNGYTVTMNVNATADNWSNAAGPTAVAGGSLTINNGVVIEGNLRAGPSALSTISTGIDFVLNGYAYGSETTTGIRALAMINLSRATVNGNSVAGFLGNAEGISVAGTSVLVLNGLAVANDYPLNPLHVSGCAGLVVAGTGPSAVIRGIKFGIGGCSPITGTGRFFAATSTAIEAVFVDSAQNPIYATALDAPLESDVRDGVVYYGGGKTGTCAVPAAQYVLPGVPIDNTVGTANISVDLTPVLTDTAAILADTAALLAQAGDGPLAVTIQTGVALSLVRVSSLGGDWTVTADNSGDAAFYLAAGDYTVTAFAPGYTWDAQAFTAADGLDVAYPGTPLSIPTPSSPDLCVCQLSLLDALSAPLTALPANSTFRVISNPIGSEHDWKNSNTAIPAESFAAGVVTLELPRGATIEWNIPNSLRAARFVVPDQPSCIVMPLINV